jgi:hypothetical protein
MLTDLGMGFALSCMEAPAFGVLLLMCSEFMDLVPLVDAVTVRQSRIDDLDWSLASPFNRPSLSCRCGYSSGRVWPQLCTNRAQSGARAAPQKRAVTHDCHRHIWQLAKANLLSRHGGSSSRSR